MKVVNVDQSAAWNGEEGGEWARHAERFNRSSRRHLERLLGSGLIETGSHVLDIGCGTGLSTRRTGRIAAGGTALGADLSAVMLDVARAATEAEGLTNVSYTEADAQVHPFERGAHDVAISLFGAMFFADARAAFTNIGSAVAPGGRLGLVAWRELARNEWLMEIRRALAVGRTLPVPPPNVPSPFALADPAYVRPVLESAGFGDVGFEPIDEPMDFGADAGDAYDFMSSLSFFRSLLADLDDADRATALEALRATIDEHTTSDGVLFDSSAWLITARRS